MPVRNPSRLDSPPDPEGDGEGRPRLRLVGGETPAGRRLSLGKLAAGVVVAAAAVGLVAAGGSRAVQSAVTWLHAQERYRLRFDEIRLDPEPGPWIKGGAPALLRRVRERAKRPETMSLLDLDLKALGRDFARESPWVMSVDRIEPAYPSRLTMRMRYRRPVGRLPIGAGAVALDRDGVVLPDEEIDFEAAGPLIELRVPGLTTAGSDFRTGRPFRVALPGSSDEDSEPAQAPARLAGFFQDLGAIAPAAKGKLAVRGIHSVKGGKLLYVETVETAMILWGAAPGNEEPGEPSAVTKLELVKSWAERHSFSEAAYDPANPKRLEIRKDRVELVPVRRARPR